MSVAQLKQGALFAGRFRIERVIGRGGMGAVYAVVEEALAVVIFALGLAARGGSDEQVAENATTTPPTLSSTPSPEESVLFAPLPVPPIAVDAGDPVLAAVTACLARNDLPCAHTALEPAVSGKKPSAYHVQLLYDLCELQADRACMATLAKQHPKVDRRAQRERTLSVPGLASPTHAASGTSVGAQAHGLMATDPIGARRLLEVRVFGLKATRVEADLLWTICHDERDATCCATVDTLYPHLTHTAR